MILRAACALSVILLSVPAVYASPLVTNGSFEDGSFVEDPGLTGATLLFPSSTVMTGWTVFNSDLAWIDNVNLFAVVASDGVKSLDLTGADTVPFGGVQQTIATASGQSYILGFDLGGNLDYNLGNSPEVLASADGTSASFTFTPAAHVQEWKHFELPFTATSSSTLVSLLGTSTGGAYIGLDNVSVNEVSATPEPPTMVLAAFGLFCLAAYGWRRRAIA
jgi:hypothetical protein